MRRVLLWIFAVVGAVNVGVIGVLVFIALDPIDSCLDHGGRWNYAVKACECTDAKTSRPGFSQANAAWCEELLPASAGKPAPN